jgi:hypothetical protein
MIALDKSGDTISYKFDETAVRVVIPKSYC